MPESQQVDPAGSRPSGDPAPAGSLAGDARDAAAAAIADAPADPPAARRRGKATVPPVEAPRKGHAVYDVTLERFAGPVHAEKSDAVAELKTLEKAATDAGAPSKYETREV